MCGCDHENAKPAYVFGSAIITISIGALAFITALAWNTYVQGTFKYYSNEAEELEAKLSYAFLVTAIAIVLGFFIMYFVKGDKW
jgi:Na+/alanine symporter